MTAGDSDDGDEASVDPDAFYDALEALGQPVLTATRFAQHRGVDQETASEAMDNLIDSGEIDRQDVSSDPVVYYPADWASMTDRERIVVFPDRRQLVVDKPHQFTRAQLSQFARLVDTTGDEGYLYEITDTDIWQAPYDSVEELLGTVRDVLPEAQPELEQWIEDQYERARQFRLWTHEDGYVVLEAATADLMGNVARQKLDDGQLRAELSDTESWVAEEAIAQIKRTLYEAGYPVLDERDLDTGDPLPVDLELELRPYQHEWVDSFIERKAGVLVGPPGSGKTVAAMGILARIEGETLILVPGRELAVQWREELLAHTTLTEDQIGEYHGGQKQVRPVTIATYQTAAMDRHRHIFEDREWGLIVYDEVQHVPADVRRRTADLQSRHRLGLSASPVREDDREEEIFTLIGPPIGTDWDALFDAGYVAQPSVEIRYVPWTDDTARNEYVSAHGHERRMLAASNPAKIAEARELLRRHAGEQALLFVDYLDQGRELAEALDVPFVSGETRHARRSQLFEQFREGTRDALVVSRVGDEGIDLPSAAVAIVASGLGGSRRQGAQRAGRTMRPEGQATVYVLATRGSREEDFARQRTRYLAEKGIRVTESDATVGEAEADDADETEADDAENEATDTDERTDEAEATDTDERTDVEE